MKFGSSMRTMYLGSYMETFNLNAVYILYDVLIRLMPNLWLIIFVFRNRLRFSFLHSNLIAIAFSGLTVAVALSMFSPYNPIQVWRLYFSVAYLFVCIVLFITTIHVSVFQGLFALFVIESYADDIALFSKITQNYMFSYLEEPFSHGAYLLSKLVVFIVTFPFMLLFMVKFMRPMIETSKHMPFWKYLWIVPASFYLIYRLSIYPAYLEPSTMIGGRILWVQCVWTAGTFLSYYIILKMLSEMGKNRNLEMRLRISDVQLSVQKEQYEILKKNIEEASRMRHDLRHHLLVMKSYIERQDFQGITAYLDYSLDELAPKDGMPICENYAANAIAQYYISIAKKNNIYVTILLDIPEKLPIIENDFCVILGNLLENAVEACLCQNEGHKFIQIKVGMHGKKIIMISIKNSFGEKIQCQGNQFLSSKRAGTGVGTASVRNITDKYHGIAKFTHENGVFHAAILLNEQN